MNHDPLDMLLRRADRAAGLPSSGPVDLAERVRRLAMRRRRITIASRAAIAAVVILSTGVALRVAAIRPSRDAASVAQKPSAANPPSDEEAARLRAEVAQLRQEANALAEQIRGMAVIREQRERLDRLEQAVARLESGEELHAQMERAAFTIVYQADRLYRELGLRESAAEAYREAIKLFPETPSAQVARARLAEIDTQGDRL